MQGQTQKEIIGLGCIVSMTLLFVSDHYTYVYSAGDLQFHPFYHEQGEKVIPVLRTIFPENITKDKKSSMSLHKRLGVALYELAQPIYSQHYFKFGINILPETT